MIILIIAVFFFFSFFELKSTSNFKSKIIFIFCILFWWFLESFRWESGTDFYNYYNNFNGLVQNEISTNRFEIGYNILTIFCRDYLHLSFYCFNSIYYAIIFTLYYFSIRKATNNTILFLFIFLCFSIGLMGSMRQLMALAIMFFAAIYFLDSKKLWFILLILLASMFHRTIIICITFVFFTSKIKYKYWLYLIVFAFFAQISGFNYLLTEKIILLLPKSFSERYFGYLSISMPDSISVKVFVMGICRRILPIILFFLFRDKLTFFSKSINIDSTLNILFFSLFAYILLSFDFTFIISRISIYFIIFEALFYSIMISMFMKEKKYLYVSALVAIFLILAYRGVINYPELFFPYKTIFFFL